MSSSDGSRDEIRVAIVSANQKTLDDLEGYLVGVQVSCTRHLDLADALALSVVALIIFPDDFLRENVITTLEAVVELRSRVLLVIVTGDPGRYERSLPKTDHLLVVPRPVWAWAIYDAIRPHLPAEIARSSGASRRRKPVER